MEIETLIRRISAEESIVKIPPQNLSKIHFYVFSAVHYHSPLPDNTLKCQPNTHAFFVI